MTQTQLLSIAAIAKLLGQPESTLHYWKNRFDTYLPSFGKGRHRRFRPEAVEIFQKIGELLRAGLSTADVRDELGRHFAVNAETGAPGELMPVQPFFPQSPGLPELTASIGLEIAKAIGAHLGALLPQASPPAADAPAVEELRDELDIAREELSSLKSQNSDLGGKLAVLEAELIRLRKDAREMEKHLVAKIKAAKTPGTPD